MPNSVPSAASSRHPVIPDIARRMARADVRIPDMAEGSEWLQAVGRAIRRAREAAGWSIKELSGKVDKDEREVAKWESGDRRPHLDCLLALPEVRRHLIFALAEECPDLQVVKQIHERRAVNE